MKKNLILYILLGFLIVVNGIFLFNYLGKPNREGPNKPQAFIVKELKFDASQKEQLKRLDDAHHKKMSTILDTLKVLKDDFFDKISDASIKEEAIDSITTLIGIKEQTKEKEVFYHFRAIHELCDAKQKERFIGIIEEARHKGEGRPLEQGPPRDGPPKH